MVSVNSAIYCQRVKRFAVFSLYSRIDFVDRKPDGLECPVRRLANTRESIIGVQNKTLEDHGAVSSEVVEEMAKGTLRLSGADIAVAVSGVAGPDGGTKEKPVGMVWFAWAVRDGANAMVDTRCEQFTGDRELVREASVAYALQGVRERIES